MFQKFRRPSGPAKNVPLTREQVKALPVAKWHTEPATDKEGNTRKGVKVVMDFGGFTSTADFPNNMMRRDAFKPRRPNNRKATPGRVTTYEKKFSHVQDTPYGKVNIYHKNRFKKIRHNNPDIKNQAFSSFDK